MVLCTFNYSIREAEAERGFCEFKTSLVYITKFQANQSHIETSL